MRRTAYEIYTLLVSLASLIGLVVASFWLLHGILSLAFTELMVYSHDYEVHRTNERYWQSLAHRDNYNRTDSKEEKGKPKPQEEELTRMRLESWEAVLQMERRNGMKTTIMAGFGFIVAGVLFAVHWKLARQARQPLDAIDTR